MSCTVDGWYGGAGGIVVGKEVVVVEAAGIWLGEWVEGSEVG